MRVPTMQNNHVVMTRITFEPIKKANHRHTWALDELDEPAPAGK